MNSSRVCCLFWFPIITANFVAVSLVVVSHNVFSHSCHFCDILLQYLHRHFHLLLSFCFTLYDVSLRVNDKQMTSVVTQIIPSILHFLHFLFLAISIPCIFSVPLLVSEMTYHMCRVTRVGLKTLLC